MGQIAKTICQAVAVENAKRQEEIAAEAKRQADGVRNRLRLADSRIDTAVPYFFCAAKLWE